MNLIKSIILPVLLLLLVTFNINELNAQCPTYDAPVYEPVACSDQQYQIRMPLASCPGETGFHIEIDAGPSFAYEIAWEVLNTTTGTVVLSGGNQLILGQGTVGNRGGNQVANGPGDPGAYANDDVANYTWGPVDPAIEGTTYILYVYDDWGDGFSCDFSGDCGYIEATDMGTGNQLAYFEGNFGAQTNQGYVTSVFGASTVTVNYSVDGTPVQTDNFGACGRINSFLSLQNPNFCTSDVQNIGYEVICDDNGTTITSGNFDVDVMPDLPTDETDLVEITINDDCEAEYTPLNDCVLGDIGNIFTVDEITPPTDGGSGTAEYLVTYIGMNNQPDPSCCETGGPSENYTFTETNGTSDGSWTASNSPFGGTNNSAYGTLEISDDPDSEGAGNAVSGEFTINVSNYQFSNDCGSEDYWVTVYVDGVIVFDDMFPAGNTSITITVQDINDAGGSLSDDSVIEVYVYPNNFSCDGDNTTYVDNNPTGHEWTADIEITGTEIEFNMQVPTPADCDFSVAIAYDCTCPDAPNAGDNAQYCEGDPIDDLNATAANNGDLTWYDDENLTNVVGTGETFTPESIPGSYTYYVTETEDGCESDATEITIEIFENPEIIEINSTEATCGDNNGEIVVTDVSGGDEPYEYSIDGGTTFQASETFTGLSGGNFTVVVQDANGCQNQDNITLNDIGAPEIDDVIITQPVSCNGECDAELEISMVDPNPDYTYQWYDASDDSEITGETNAVISNLCAGEYYVIVEEDAGGGGDPDTIWFEDFGNGCDQGQLADGFNSTNGVWTVTNTGANDPEANIWFVSAMEQIGSNDCGTGCGGDNNRTLHVGNAEVPTLALPADNGAAYNAGGVCASFGICVTTDKRVESPVIDLSGQADVELSFDYIEFGDDGTGFDFAELWYFDGATWSMLVDLAKTNCCGGPCDGTTQGEFTNFTVALPPSADNNPNVQIGFRWENNDDGIGQDPSFAVDNIALITGGNGGGETCPATSNIVEITEPDELTATFNIINQSCDAEGSIEVNASGGTEPYTYSNDNGTTFQGSELFTELNAGDFDIVVEDANGCTFDETVTVGQDDNPPVIDNVMTQDVSCFDEEDGIITIDASGEDPLEYSIDGGANFDVNNTFEDLPAGSYDIVVIDADGCETTQTVNIDQPDEIQIDAVAIDESCIGSEDGSIEVFATQGGNPPYTYTWNGDPGTENLTDLSAGEYVLIIEDDEGCTYSETFTISTNEFEADFEVDPTTGMAPLEISLVYTGDNASEIIWVTGTGDTISGAVTNYTYEEDGEFELILIANDGVCSDTLYTTIIVQGESFIEVPNIFTPNNDGVNDEFRIISQGIDDFHCQIYNRWGQLIYELNEPNHTWRGRTTSGTEASEGTYFVILTAKGFDGVDYEIQSSVTLKR